MFHPFIYSGEHVAAMVEAGILTTVVTLLVRLAGEQPLDGQVLLVCFYTKQSSVGDKNSTCPLIITSEI